MSEHIAPRAFALVTGASGGIGSRIATRLAEAGYGVLAQYRTPNARLDAIADACADRGTTYIQVQAELADSAGIREVSARAVELVEAGAQLRVLVNNAAALLSPEFGRTEPEDFDRYVAINARAPFFLTQQLFEHMPSGASIVNISSASAHFSSPGDISYAMSKAMLEAFTAHAAEPLAERGIRVNNVIPGFTDNGYELFRNEAAREYMDSFSVLGGVADPDDIAHAVLYLASPAARRVTGTSLDVTGGSTLGARHRRKRSVREYL